MKCEFTEKLLLYQSLNHLTNLTNLSLFCNKYVTDKALSLLTNLTILDLSNNSTITDEGINLLTNLTSIILWCNEHITDEGISLLTNLFYNTTDSWETYNTPIQYIDFIGSVENTYEDCHSTPHLFKTE